MQQINIIIYVTRRNPPVADLIQYKSPSCRYWNIIGLLSERKTTEYKNTNCDSAAAPRFILLSTCGTVTLQHLYVLYLYIYRVTGAEEEFMFTVLVSGRRHDSNTQVWFPAVIHTYRYIDIYIYRYIYRYIDISKDIYRYIYISIYIYL